MLRPFIKINIQQIPTELWKKRNDLIPIDFVNSFDLSKGWENHTDNLTLTLPKNVVLLTGDFLFKQSGTYNVILGSSGNNTASMTDVLIPPLIMRGDVVVLQYGYWFRNQQGVDVSVGTSVYSGYISKTYSDIPIKFDCEDNFYLLKRTPVNKSIWKGSLIGLCNHIVEQVNAKFGQNSALEINGINPYPTLTVFNKPDSITADFSLGYLEIGDMSCAKLLDTLRNRYHIESFFVGNELRFGFPIYDEETSDNSKFFIFNENIKKDHNLEYNNKDDIELSAVVSVQTLTKTGKTTQDGSQGTKKIRKSLLVYWDVITQSFKYIEAKTGEKFPDNTGGERHEFIYPVDIYEATPSTDTLFKFGIAQLSKYMYTGFRGSFKTIGYPFVNWNDNINILDKVILDRKGTYKVKKVKVSFNASSNAGIEQEIFLDYKLNIETPEPNTEIYII